MIKKKNFYLSYNKLEFEKKYILFLLIIKYWKENGIKINKNKKIFPNDIGLNYFDEFLNENKISICENDELKKIYYEFLKIKEFHKINFIIDKILVLSICDDISFADYAYNLIKIQKSMFINNYI